MLPLQVISNSLITLILLLYIKHQIFTILLTYYSLHALFIPCTHAALVKPHLDYTCVVWQPYLLKDIRTLVAVQRRATRVIPCLANLTYIDRLKSLHQLPLLYYRKIQPNIACMALSIWLPITAFHCLTLHCLQATSEC